MLGSFGVIPRAAAVAISAWSSRSAVGEPHGRRQVANQQRAELCPTFLEHATIRSMSNIEQSDEAFPAIAVGHHGPFMISHSRAAIGVLEKGGNPGSPKGLLEGNFKGAAFSRATQYVGAKAV